MKNKIKNQFRQGDVLIERTTDLPENSKNAPGRVILAHGEATGHAHEIDMESAHAFQRDGQTVAINVLKPSEVRHQEHAPIPVKRGKYRITRQREYSPEAIRNVAD